MKTDIGKFVDEIIEGLRLLTYKYIEIVWKITRNPFRAPLALAEEYHNDQEKWPSPHLILFLTIGLIWLYQFSLTSVLTNRFENLNYLVATGEPPKGWLELLVRFIATFLILDIVLYFGFGKLFLEASRRKIIHSAAIYLYASIMLIFEIVRNLLLVISRQFIEPSLNLLIFRQALPQVVFLFVLGIPLGYLLIKEIIDEKKWPRQVDEKGIYKVIFILFVGLITVYLITEGRAFLIKIGTLPLPAPTLRLVSHECVVEDKRVVALIIVENRGATYKLLSKNFFSLYLAPQNPDKTFRNKDTLAKIEAEVVESSIGQVGNTYIIPPSKDGIFLVEANQTGVSRYKDWLLQQNITSFVCRDVLIPETP